MQNSMSARSSELAKEPLQHAYISPGVGLDTQVRIEVGLENVTKLKKVSKIGLPISYFD